MYPKHRNSPQGPIASPSFPELEKEVLAYWDKDGTFQESIDQRAATDAPEFVFYDGPPFANGLPHYGHLLTGYAKDLVPRYQTMRGKRVERRFGWDTHGLPAEVEAERLLGISGRPEIEKYGVAKFNEFCKTSVLKYTEDWRSYITRQARWVDFDNDYKTLDQNYTESVIWAFQQLYNKGLIYEGFKVLAYCWRCETPLSNHELKMDEEVYRDRQDQSVTVTFEITSQGELAGVKMLAWTTTPWTLPTNFALAVGPKIEYALVHAKNSDLGDEKFLIASALLPNYVKELGFEDAESAAAAVSKTYLGSELAGLRYEPIFDFYTDANKFSIENAWQVLVGDYVTAEDGTGIVHQAPAYGEDDQILCNAAGIPTYVSVNERGEFISLIAPYEGQHVFEANKPITQDLKAKNRLLRQASYDHSYPHCYRCKNPLIYKAVSSWFVETTKVRDRMLELNQEINWVPDHTKNGGFGKWLENVRDWAISRNRFWGAPIPVWKSDDPNYPRLDVYGSLDEMERDFGIRPTDFHRPVIDELTRPNPDDPTGKSTMRRVPEVLDCWFESGSMPFAQVHYPFENQDWFDSHFPGDYIVEYVGQTKGWFYTLHVLSTALFDRPAFKNAVSHGIVLGNDGQKMSKSLRNYPDVNEVFDRDGSDAMRWFLMSSPILRGGNISVTEQGIREGVRQALLPLWNSYYFFALYANASSYTASPSMASTQLLDRYILAKTRELIDSVALDLDIFDSFAASAKVRDFAEVLTNWYIRRSRDRFWEGDKDAFDTLYTVLESAFRVIAPMLPLVAEEMWRGLTNGRSVHLESWPEAEEFLQDAQLVRDMDAIREAASSGLSLRKSSGIRVRQPLAKITLAVVGSETLRDYAELLADELNVKKVDIVEANSETSSSFGLRQSLSVNARALGPRVGKDVQRIIGQAKLGNWEQLAEGIFVDGTLLMEPEYELTLVADNESSDFAVGVTSSGFILLDTRLTPELQSEGLARDTIRHIQQARKDFGLDVSDRISLKLACDEESLTALETHSDLISRETLAADIEVVAGQIAAPLSVGETGSIEITLAKK
jgi:isoleucyl-tRNA synthetase